MFRRRFLKLLAALPLAGLFGWQTPEEDEYTVEGIEMMERYLDGFEIMPSWEGYIEKVKIHTGGYIRIQDDAKWGYKHSKLYASHDGGETWIPIMTPNDWEV